jgi:hypothetical protein
MLFLRLASNILGFGGFVAKLSLSGDDFFEEFSLFLFYNLKVFF